jgi:hypothetical protein
VRASRLVPILVAALLLLAFGSAWIASRTAARTDGFAGSAAVALWLLGFGFLAFAVAAVGAGVTLVHRRQLTGREKVVGVLPLLLLMALLVLVYLWLGA